MRQVQLYRKGVWQGFCLEESEFLSYEEYLRLHSTLQCQYLTPKHHFYSYVSRKVLHVSKAKERARDFVLSFKSGKVSSCKRAVKLVSSFLKREGLCSSEYTFICIPSSSPEKNELRFKEFTSMVSAAASVENGFNLVQVVGSRSEVHAGGSRDICNYVVSPMVKGRKVIVFDDVETTGITFASFAAELERIGAEVVQGVFLAVAETH